MTAAPESPGGEKRAKRTAASQVIEAVEVEFPEQFQGIFHRQKPRYLPLMKEARRVLRDLEVPPVVRENYVEGVLEHAQPSFMLLPMMYLALADHAGGITPRHRRYLPWYVLAMELVAVLDDTVDRTPYRSGRLTYHERFGDPSATAFSAFLLSVVTSRTVASAPEVSPLVADLFEKLCALQTWEYHARYPEPEPDGWSAWLQNHYDAVTPAVAHALNGALAIHGEPFVTDAVCAPFGEIMQDVDDLVNFVERRDQDGENSDFDLGIVTYPMLSTLRAAPGIAAPVRDLWAATRRSPSAGEVTPRLADPGPNAATREELMAAIAEHGIPATIAKIHRDAEQAIAATPRPFRACVEEMVVTFVDRVAPFEAASSA